MKNDMMSEFIMCLVSITTEPIKDTFMVFQGLLLDIDEHFIYLSRDGSGEVDTAIKIDKVFTVEYFEDTPDKVDKKAESKMEEFNEKIELAKKLLPFDDDDNGGKLQ